MREHLAGFTLEAVFREGEGVVGGAVVEVAKVLGLRELFETEIAVGCEGAEGGVGFADGFAGC